MRVRKDCEDSWISEGRPTDVSPDQYLGLGSLIEIIKSRKNLFVALFQDFLGGASGGVEELVKLRGIRNFVMHPCRGKTPSETEIKFIKTMRRRRFMRSDSPSPSGRAEG